MTAQKMPRKEPIMRKNGRNKTEFISSAAKNNSQVEHYVRDCMYRVLIQYKNKKIKKNSV